MDKDRVGQPPSVGGIGWDSVSVRILVQVEANEEKSAEKIYDNIPPKAFGLFGAVHNTVVALQGFPTEREDRRHD
jgi:hypothetical protein